MHCPIDGHSCRREGCLKNNHSGGTLECDKTIIEITNDYVTGMEKIPPLRGIRKIVYWLLNRRIISKVYDTAESLDVDPDMYADAINKSIMAEAVKLAGDDFKKL